MRGGRNGKTCEKKEAPLNGRRETHQKYLPLLKIFFKIDLHMRSGGRNGKTCEKKLAPLNSGRETHSFSRQVGTKIRMSKASV